MHKHLYVFTTKDAKAVVVAQSPEEAVAALREYEDDSPTINHAIEQGHGCLIEVLEFEQSNGVIAYSETDELRFQFRSQKRTRNDP